MFRSVSVSALGLLSHPVITGQPGKGYIRIAAAGEPRPGKVPYYLGIVRSARVGRRAGLGGESQLRRLPRSSLHLRMLQQASAACCVKPGQKKAARWLSRLQ